MEEMMTNIEWRDETWLPTTGCTLISDGCKNCSGQQMTRKMAGRDGYSRDNPFGVTLHPNRLEIPFHWRKPRRVSVCSMGDLFHGDVPLSYVAAVFGVMAANPQHRFQIITKRPGRMLDFFRMLHIEETPSLDCAYHLLLREEESHPDGVRGPIHCKYGPAPKAVWPLKNVWLGVSVENQKTANERIPHLLQCEGAVRFVSYEPALGPINFMMEDDEIGERWNTLEMGIDWLIAGGESGPGARPMHPGWVRSVRDQCQAANVPFFFESWGDWMPGEVTGPDVSDFRNCYRSCGDGEIVVFSNEPERHSFDNLDPYSGDVCAWRVGKKQSGCQIDGRMWEEFPRFWTKKEIEQVKLYAAKQFSDLGWDKE